MRRLAHVHVGEILGLNEFVPELSMVFRVTGGLMSFGYDNALLSHLCGDIYPIEYGMAQREARRELRRQLPWLTSAIPPGGALRARDWAFNWAWVDTMGLKHGYIHPIASMDPRWRSQVPLRSFQGYTQDHREVTFDDLPEELREELRRLGYSEGVI